MRTNIVAINLTLVLPLGLTEDYLIISYRVELLGETVRFRTLPRRVRVYSVHVDGCGKSNFVIFIVTYVAYPKRLGFRDRRTYSVHLYPAYVPVEQYELSLPMTVWFTFSRPTHDLNGRKLRAPRCVLFWHPVTRKRRCALSCFVRGPTRLYVFTIIALPSPSTALRIVVQLFVRLPVTVFSQTCTCVCARWRYDPKNVFSINVFRSPAVFGSVRSSKRRPITVSERPFRATRWRRTLNFLRHRHLEPAVRTCRETRRDTTGNCISVDISDGRFEGERTRKFPGFILQNYRRPKQTTPRIGYRIIAGTRIITIDSFCDFYDRRNRLRTDIAKRTVGARTLAEFTPREACQRRGSYRRPERSRTAIDSRRPTFKRPLP